jgi:chromosome segregation ATPase
MPQQPILVPVAPGELIDKLTILSIKNERIKCPKKLQNIRTELSMLQHARDGLIQDSQELDSLSGQLKEVNQQLWDIEDAIRRCESQKDFGERFVELARSVYRTNDRRSTLKRQINELLCSCLIEEKDYQEY